jgi:hypothetical protein
MPTIAQRNRREALLDAEGRGKSDFRDGVPFTGGFDLYPDDKSKRRRWESGWCEQQVRDQEADDIRDKWRANLSGGW